MDRHPEVVRAVYAAFEAARARAASNQWKLHESSPWLLDDLEAQARLMGPGFDRLGEDNRRMIARFCEEQHRAGIDPAPARPGLGLRRVPGARGLTGLGRERELGAGGPATVTRRQQLRALVAARRGLVVPGAYDAVSARLVEQAGFPAVYMTGFGVSAARLGLPDLGFAGLAEMVDQARNLASAVSSPLIADADTGYGNALQVRRTVQQYELAGVAALHLEDQAAPKRCGHLAGKQVVPVEEFTGRIRAAVEARTDPDLLIIARTDAVAVNGFDDAVQRAAAAGRAGADVLSSTPPPRPRSRLCRAGSTGPSCSTTRRAAGRRCSRSPACAPSATRS